MSSITANDEYFDERMPDKRCRLTEWGESSFNSHSRMEQWSDSWWKYVQTNDTAFILSYKFSNSLDNILDFSQSLIFLIVATSLLGWTTCFIQRENDNSCFDFLLSGWVLSVIRMIWKICTDYSLNNTNLWRKDILKFSLSPISISKLEFFLASAMKIVQYKLWVCQL
jgi:hypothetical protein